MKLSQLLYFTTTVKHNSISKAAKVLYVSQPAISMAIRELEEEFNTTFFTRNNNQLTLTEEGNHFYSLANSLLSHSQRVKNEMVAYIRNREALKLGIPPMLGTFIIPSILEKFSSIHPHIQVDVEEYGSVNNQKAVVYQDIDIALTVIYQGKIDSSLDYIKIGETELLLTCDKSNKLSKLNEISFEELQDEPLVLMKDDTLQGEIIKKLFQKENIEPNIKIRSNQLYTILELINHVNYSGFLFDRVSKPDNTVSIPFKEKIIFDIVIAWNKKATLSKLGLEFINFIKNDFKL